VNDYHGLGYVQIPAKEIGRLEGSLGPNLTSFAILVFDCSDNSAVEVVAVRLDGRELSPPFNDKKPPPWTTRYDQWRAIKGVEYGSHVEIEVQNTSDHEIHFSAGVIS